MVSFPVDMLQTASPQACVPLGQLINSPCAPGECFLFKNCFLSLLFSSLSPPPPPNAFSLPLLIILATNTSGFPLSNQITVPVSGTWLAPGADRFWPAYSKAVLTKPGQMFGCCYFPTTSVQRFGGGKADFSSV